MRVSASIHFDRLFGLPLGHVMEHESFENETIARLMNQWYVCVKVDREERPVWIRST